MMAENTYRTILFEEFNRDEDNAGTLDSILSTAEKPDGETVYHEVKEKLSVHNFNEFLEKFAPKVYEKYEPSPDGDELVVTYSTKYSPGAVPLNIVNHSYYKMLLNLYHSKETGNESNLKFNYEEIFDQLKPEQEIEAAKILRKKLNAAYEKYYDCKKKGESTDEARKMFKDLFQKVRDTYEKSLINTLPLAMEDLKAKMEAADKLLAQNAGKDADEVLQIASGYTSFFKEDGTLGTAPVQLPSPDDKIEELPAKQIGSGERKLLSDVIASDYDNRVKTENKNSFVRDLVISTYAPLTTANTAVNMSLADVRRQQDFNLAKKRSYEKTFQNAKDSFIKAMTETVQKLLGVQILFDHATLNGELKDGLIVANCSAGFLIRNFKDTFTGFINRVGHDSVGNRIWFAIVPGVSEELDNSAYDDDEDILGGPSDKTDPVETNSSKTVSINELKQFLPIMDEARVMTIFSFKPDEKNGFLMTPKYLEEKRDIFRDINNKHAVYAYPNFTLTRPRTMELFKGAEKKLAIPGVYIDAAYVAGGLLIGSQQLSYLEKHGLPVHRQLPCVHIDFENTAVRSKLLTKFNKESDFDVNENLRNEINKDRMGFVFSGEALGDIKNTYVYIANTLDKRSGNNRNVYCPIYATLVDNYVRAEFNRVQDKSPQGVQREFIKGTVAKWKRYSESKEHRNDVNLLLRENESIILEGNRETGKPEIKIKLSKVEIPWDDIAFTTEQNS